MDNASSPASPTPDTLGSVHSGESTFIHTRAVRIHAVSQGKDSDPLVVCIHGFGGGWYEWAPVMELLKDAPVHLVAIDLRGNGLSDKPPRGYNPTTLASDISGIIRSQSGGGPVTLITHGESAEIAWTLDAQEPARVDRIINLAGSHPEQLRHRMLWHPFEQRRYRHEEFLLQFSWLAKKILRRKKAAVVRKRFLQSVGCHYAGTQQAAYMAGLRQESLCEPKVVECATEYRQWGLHNRLERQESIFKKLFPKHTAAKVVVVSGGEDPYKTSRCADATARKGNEDSFVRMIDSVGHFPHLEDPTMVAEIIMQNRNV